MSPSSSCYPSNVIGRSTFLPVPWFPNICYFCPFLFWHFFGNHRSYMFKVYPNIACSICRCVSVSLFMVFDVNAYVSDAYLNTGISHWFNISTFIWAFMYLVIPCSTLLIFLKAFHASFTLLCVSILHFFICGYRLTQI